MQGLEAARKAVWDRWASKVRVRVRVRVRVTPSLSLTLTITLSLTLALTLALTLTKVALHEPALVQRLLRLPSHGFRVVEWHGPYPPAG